MFGGQGCGSVFDRSAAEAAKNQRQPLTGAAVAVVQPFGWPYLLANMDRARARGIRTGLDGIQTHADPHASRHGVCTANSQRGLLNCRIGARSAQPTLNPKGFKLPFPWGGVLRPPKEMGGSSKVAAAEGRVQFAAEAARSLHHGKAISIRSNRVLQPSSMA